VMSAKARANPFEILEGICNTLCIYFARLW
jgi:hypothetical protein